MGTVRSSSWAWPQASLSIPSERLSRASPTETGIAEVSDGQGMARARGKVKDAKKKESGVEKEMKGKKGRKER